MKSILVLVTMLTVLMGLTTGCAETAEDVQPLLEDAALRQVVQGKWRIERVNSKLCRGSNCTSVVYTGRSDDFFEFRADSAFIQRAALQGGNGVYRDSFKADYSVKGALLLSNFGWAARFRILRHDHRSLVLEGSYSGSDPSAVFTDTYFLQR